MTVKELIKLLERENPEAEVILASDSEGNTYHFLYPEFEYAPMATLSPWWHEPMRPDEIDEDIKVETIPALILYPDHRRIS